MGILKSRMSAKCNTVYEAGMTQWSVLQQDQEHRKAWSKACRAEGLWEQSG